MKRITTYTSIALITLLTGCVTIESREYVEYVKIDSPNTFSSELDTDATVFLKLPPGKINILESTDGQTFKASISRSCPEPDLLECRQELEEVEFIAKSRDGEYSLSTNKSTVFASDGKFTFNIHVPDIHHLALDVTAGEINVSALRSCFTADVTAGDVNIEAYADELRSVYIHASAGDTSLRVNGRNIPENRMLMRSNTQWHSGDGTCELKAEVSAGEVSVKVI